VLPGADVFAVKAWFIPVWCLGAGWLFDRPCVLIALLDPLEELFNLRFAALSELAHRLFFDGQFPNLPCVQLEPVGFRKDRFADELSAEAPRVGTRADPIIRVEVCHYCITKSCSTISIFVLLPFTPVPGQACASIFRTIYWIPLRSCHLHHVASLGVLDIFENAPHEVFDAVVHVSTSTQCVGVAFDELVALALPFDYVAGKASQSGTSAPYSCPGWIEA